MGTADRVWLISKTSVYRGNDDPFLNICNEERRANRGGGGRKAKGQKENKERSKQLQLVDSEGNNTHRGTGEKVTVKQG